MMYPESCDFMVCMSITLISPFIQSCTRFQFMQQVCADEQLGDGFFFFAIILLFCQVTSPYGNNLHHNENVTHGLFAFTTTEGGNYLACFTVDSHQGPATSVTLSLDWKIGIAAKDWDSVAKKEKIEVSFLNPPSFPAVLHSLVAFLSLINWV